MSIKYAFPLKIPDNSPDNFIMFSHAAEVYILIVNTQRFLYAYLLSALPCAGACGPCRPCVPPSGGRLFRCGVPEHALGCISACGASYRLRSCFRSAPPPRASTDNTAPVPPTVCNTARFPPLQAARAPPSAPPFRRQTPQSHRRICTKTACGLYILPSCPRLYR